jgi:uncharacterized protein (TIGR03790 family)
MLAPAARLPTESLRAGYAGRMRTSLTRLLNAALPLSAALLLTACGGGGGSAGGSAPPPPDSPVLSASQLAVLVAEGQAYLLARGVPAANLIRLPVPTGQAALTPAQFATLKAALDARMPATMQATLVTWSQPSRVAGACVMGLTSALAFGYDAAYCGECRATTVSPLYASSTRQPFAELGVRPSMMLGASTLAEAETLIRRGVAADGSWLATAPAPASGQAVLVRTTDAARSVRFSDFMSLRPSPVPRLTTNFIDNASGLGSDFVSNQTGVMFYLTGLATVPQIETHAYLPGAVADHLTSLAGVTEPGANTGGQMPATAWLRAGATGTYGTVEEPCNLPDKFPRASVLVRRYAAGDTLIEAYWKSVRTPGQGNFYGEPLARPWASRP